jgi:heterodisulfide reductase subunit A
MMEAWRHPSIEILSYSEVDNVSGYVGNFTVKVRRKARYVVEEDCTACGDCSEVCPSVVPAEFQIGLAARKAIFIPFPQAVPSSYTIDMDACLGNNPIACGKCEDVCQKKCIDFDMEDEIVELEVGAIVVATGMDPFDPSGLDEYGYGKHADVLTSMEFERMLSVDGPSGGHLVRPSDGKEPESVAFIQCVGSRSRDGRGKEYCSNICCMNTVKDTLLLRDHYPNMDVDVYYMDIRAFGKGFEEMFMRSKEAGVTYIRGIPGEVTNGQANGKLKLTVENTTSGKLLKKEVDMVVLSVGGVPRQSAPKIRSLLTISKSPDGFMQEAHPKLRPVEAATKGVYICGCAESPKDVKDSVCQAGFAASRANALLAAGEVTVEAITSRIDETSCNYCGLCTKVCPYGAITKPDKKAGVAPMVVEAACAGCGTCAPACSYDAISMQHFTDDQYEAQVDAILAEKPEDKVLIFACNWCSYPGGDTAGVARLQYPPSQRLIRTMCSGRVHPDWVMRGFELGAAVVAVTGCHYTDCHYIDAVHQTQKRVDKLWDRIDKLGIRPERLRLEWISSAQGARFAETMQELEEFRMTVTQEEIDAGVKAILDEKENKRKKAEEKAAKAAAKKKKAEAQAQ